MWIKILSGIIIFSRYLKRYHHTCVYYRSFENKHLNVQHRFLYYNAYIKSHIRYWCAVWGDSCNFNAYKIEKLERRASKLVLRMVIQH